MCSHIYYICIKYNFTMINLKEFSIRLKKIMSFYELSASSFAEKANFQRSSISHILSGRNKPSLEFILKITSEFKEVDINWLLYGKGTFPKEYKTIETKPAPPLFNKGFEKTTKSIQRIITLNNDGTFEEYKK